MPHIRKIAISLAPALIATSIAGCASPYAAPPPPEPLAITPQTSAALSTYLRAVKVTRPGAFAVSPDGRNSFYTYCGQIRCAVSNYSMPALRGCHNLSGTPCVLLYVRDEPRLAFTRIENDLPGRHGSERQREVDFDLHDR
ncbi:hypothetical protein [Dongia deserti]|uniref:hypothetical protein n=1 Tax=Dongia deserti TaxID=2268030 RepID=UPI000E65109E|nr:hypothetical protein [Dongia deserti]